MSLAPTTTRKPPVTNPATGPDGVVRDAEGNLVSANRSQVQTLAGALGQSATPATPAGAQALGATPMSAAMTGTPAALAAQAGSPGGTVGSGASSTPGGAPATPAAPRTLRSVVEQEQYGAPPPVGTPDVEARRKEDAARLSARFGDLGSRVQGLIDSFNPALFGGAPGGTTTTSQDVGGGVSIGSTSGEAHAGQTALETGSLVLTAAGQKLTPATQALLGHLETPEAIRTATEAVAREAGVSPAAIDLAQYVGGATLAGVVDAGVKHAAVMTNDVAAALGYSSTAQLAADLGVPQDQVDGKSLADIRALVEGHFASQYQDVDTARAALADPAVGPNERAAARQYLRSAGAAGDLATHDDLRRVQQSISSSDTVEFDGDQVPVGQLLSDGRVTALAGQWAASPPDSEFRKQLTKEEPGLAKFLGDHENVITEATHQLESGLGSFRDLQAANGKGLSDFSTANGLSAGQTTAILKAIDPSYDPNRLVTQATATPADLTQLTTTIQKAGLDSTRVLQALADVAAQDPAAFTALRKGIAGSAQQIAQIMQGAASPADATAKLAFLGKEMALPANASLDDVTKYIFGSSASDAQAEVARAKREREFGGAPDPTKEQELAILDADGDGRLDDPSTIRRHAENQFLQGSLSAQSKLAGTNADLSKSMLGPFAKRVITDGKPITTATIPYNNLEDMTGAQLAGTVQMLQDRGLIEPDAVATLKPYVSRLQTRDAVLSGIGTDYRGDRSKWSNDDFGFVEQLGHAMVAARAAGHDDPQYFRELLSSFPNAAHYLETASIGQQGLAEALQGGVSTEGAPDTNIAERLTNRLSFPT